MVIMSDIFLQEDINHILCNKFVVIIGDSIQRAIYKDLVLLLQRNRYLSDAQLRSKGEFSFVNDELIEGGKKAKMCNGKGYREVRQYQSDYNLVRFYFVTRCYNTYIESVLADLSCDPKPDLVIMNSCLWDISRYGASAVDQYKKNLERLFTRFEETFPKECMVIWNTTLPISKNAKGGFLVPEVEFMNSTLRLDILEANFYARQIAVAHNLDVLDLHYFLRHQLHRRADDGIHWDMTAHRRMTNLIMTHVCEAWREQLPGRVDRNRNETKQMSRNVEREDRIDHGRYSDPRNDNSRNGHREENLRPNDNSVREDRWNGNFTNFTITRNNNAKNTTYQEYLDETSNNHNNYTDARVIYDPNARSNMAAVQNRPVPCSPASVLQAFKQMSSGEYQWQPYQQNAIQPLSRSYPHYRQTQRENPYNSRSVKVGHSWSSQW
ncbi:PC-esterase domain-containing protein 1A-like [Pecten maximus]|uniref:PC-esterase domain-containing protein 1A-like n=1 Tax=Pecten maximus TaxID=6579 RepID=UPI001458B6C2|nr:PC-esterase domain-containing protein 1A-like [Pecten maximus]XP_033757689.1 PC-esterase domain-containing protein 1A-like [Pecten maximus]